MQKSGRDCAGVRGEQASDPVVSEERASTLAAPQPYLPAYDPRRHYARHLPAGLARPRERDRCANLPIPNNMQLNPRIIVYVCIYVHMHTCILYIFIYKH